MTIPAAADVLPHHQALLALLQGIAPGTPIVVPDGAPASQGVPTGAYLGVYDGEVPTDPLVDVDGRVRPYCVLHPTPGRPANDRADGTAPDLFYRFGVAAVGGDNGRCLWARDRVVAALVSVALTVEGRVCGLIHAGPGVAPVARTDDARPPRFIAALTFNFISV